MPIYDYECNVCGAVFESIQRIDSVEVECSCGSMAERIISCGRCYIGNEDASWLKTVHNVINKDTKNPAAHEFLKNPTRTNRKKWMESEGIRPLERNEPIKPPAVDMGSIQKHVWDKFQERHKIEI